MRVNGILSFLSFCDVCSDDCRSNCGRDDGPVILSNLKLLQNYSKMIPRLVESFRNLHLFHSNATKT